MATPQNDPAAPLLRILVLPGIAQTGEAFRLKAEIFQKDVLSMAEFHYIDAPLTIGLEDIGDALSWYDCDEPVKFSWYDFPATAPRWSRFEDSLAYLDHIFATKGPFDGIVGFSQGAAMTIVLSALLERGEAPPNVNFRFACVMSGFLPKDPKWLSVCTAQKITRVKSIHFFGSADTVRFDNSISIAVSSHLHMLFKPNDIAV